MKRFLTILICAIALCSVSFGQTKTTTKAGATAAKKPTSTVQKTTTTQTKKTSVATQQKQQAKTTTTTAKKTTTTTAKKPATTAKKPATPVKKTSTPTNSTIRGLQKEQAAIKQNIRKQEQALRANKAQVQEKLNNLLVINGEMDKRRVRIDSLNNQVNHLDGQLSLLQNQLSTLDKELKDRKARYVRSMRYMARQRGIQSQLMFIFSGKGFSQILRRFRFVRDYAAYQRSQGKAVKEQQARVSQKHDQVKTVKGEKSVLLNKGKQEQAVLAGQATEQQRVVSSLQKEQSNIQSIIDEQKKKDAALNAQIDKLVAAEVEKARQRAAAEAKRKAEQAAAAKKKAEELARKKAAAEAAAKENARRIAAAKAAEEKAKAAARAATAKDAAAKARAEQAAKEAESARIAAERKAAADKERASKEVARAKKESDEATSMSSADRMVNGGFEANKGRLPSPISGGKIVSHFGQHNVEGLNNVVLDNKGINILGSPGCAARAIYDGEVSAVFNMGGTMGVLVRHGSYISVYCNLSSVSVSSGQKISARQVLGTVGRDNILQFQLRKETSKLNPEAWLAR